MRHGTWQRLALVTLALGATPACTAVLGMDRATLDSDAGAGAGGAAVMQPNVGGAPTTSGNAWATTCTPTQECTNCLQTVCWSDVQACLGKPDCRAKLDSYARCVQAKGCNSSIDCAETKLGEQDSNEARDVASCLHADTCGKQCDGTVLMTKCELYCDCMSQSCSSQFAELGGSKAACLDKCTHLEPKNADCRWEHCEYAPLDSAHCEHAMDRGACGFSDNTVKCLDGQETGFPCKVDDDCCSGNCSGNVCR